MNIIRVLLASNREKENVFTSYTKIQRAYESSTAAACVVIPSEQDALLQKRFEGLTDLEIWMVKSLSSIGYSRNGLVKTFRS